MLGILSRFCVVAAMIMLTASLVLLPHSTALADDPPPGSGEEQTAICPGSCDNSCAQRTAPHCQGVGVHCQVNGNCYNCQCLAGGPPSAQVCRCEN